MTAKISQLYHWLRGQDPRIKPSSRYAAGLESYGKKVKSEKRKARILAKLNLSGVKPRMRRKMRRRYITMEQYRASMQDPKRMQSTRFVFAGRGRVT